MAAVSCFQALLNNEDVKKREVYMESVLATELLLVNLLKAMSVQYEDTAKDVVCLVCVLQLFLLMLVQMSVMFTCTIRW